MKPLNLKESVDNTVTLKTLCCSKTVTFNFDPRYLTKLGCECPNCNKKWEVTFLPMCGEDQEKFYVRDNWRVKR